MTLAMALDTYADAHTMQALLQACMPGFAEGRLHIDAIEVRRVRHSAPRERKPCPLTLCYDMEVSEPAVGRHGRQLLHAQVFLDDDAALACVAAHRAPLAPPSFGEPMVYLPMLNLLIWALPNDPGLPQLTALLDEQAVARLLPEESAGPAKVELLRYEPQGRATLRYLFTRGLDGSLGTVYAKTFCDGRGESVYRRFSYFWQQAQNDAGAPLVGRPVGHDAATRSFWQAPAPGSPLHPQLGSEAAPLLMKRAAKALAQLHAAPLMPAADAVIRTVDHWIGEVWRRRQSMRRADPAWAGRAARVAQAIEAHASRATRRPLSLIHGNFHHDQIRVWRGRVVLFDFDEFTLGDPMEDLASFLLKLELAGVAPELTTAFVDAYEAAAPQRFDPCSLAWHLTLGALLQATRGFVYQRAGWSGTAELQLAASEARATALRAMETV